VSTKADRLTLAAIALAAFALSNVVHEGVGHGGACLLVGGRAVALSAIHFEGDLAGLSPAAGKWMATGGTLANLALGLLAWAALRAARAAPGSVRLFLWLSMTINLLQAAGYWLFSGIGGFGDWAEVIEGWEPRWAFRLGLTALGGVAYWALVQRSLRELVPLLGPGPGLWRRALPVTVVPYLVGGVLYVAAGFLNPVSPLLVLVSAAAASFGGTSGLAWMAQPLRNERRFPPHHGPAPGIPRSPAWLAAGAAIALLFVGVLGPGIRF
jgi:hypothetical protein